MQTWWWHTHCEWFTAVQSISYDLDHNALTPNIYAQCHVEEESGVRLENFCAVAEESSVKIVYQSPP